MLSSWSKSLQSEQLNWKLNGLEILLEHLLVSIRSPTLTAVSESHYGKVNGVENIINGKYTVPVKYRLYCIGYDPAVVILC